MLNQITQEINKAEKHFRPVTSSDPTHELACKQAYLTGWLSEAGFSEAEIAEALMPSDDVLEDMADFHSSVATGISFS